LSLLSLGVDVDDASDAGASLDAALSSVGGVAVFSVAAVSGSGFAPPPQAATDSATTHGNPRLLKSRMAPGRYAGATSRDQR
jgi:hypothetical protein